MTTWGTEEGGGVRLPGLTTLGGGGDGVGRGWGEYLGGGGDWEGG